MAILVTHKTKPTYFMIDNRDRKMITYSMPFIPQKELRTVSLVPSPYCIPLFLMYAAIIKNGDPCTIPAKPTTDTVKYKLYIEDRSGHRSNEIELQPIVINCKRK